MTHSEVGESHLQIVKDTPQLPFQNYGYGKPITEIYGQNSSLYK